MDDGTQGAVAPIHRVPLVVDIDAPPDEQAAQARAVARALGGGDWAGCADDDLAVGRVSGGITNALLRVTQPCLADGAAASVLVRVFGTNTEIVIDRARDEATFATLSALGFGPRLLGAFATGRVEEFWPGVRALEPREMGQAAPVNYLRAIARAVARMHALPVPGDRSPLLWPQLDAWLRLAESVRFDAAAGGVEGARAAALAATVDLATARRDLQWARARLPSPDTGHGATLLAARALELAGGAPPACETAVAALVAPLTVPRGADAVAQARLDAAALMYAVVFAHNDLLAGNVLVCAGDGSDGSAPTAGSVAGVIAPGAVRLIDYEYAGYNYAGFDVCNHWCEHAGFDFDLDAGYPRPRAQAEWLAAYAQARGAPRHLWDVASPESAAAAATAGAALDEMARVANGFAVASDLWWGLWSLVQARHSPLDFDYLGYAAVRLGAVSRHRREFWGACDQ